MKLLFDQNLSPRLVDRLADIFPDSKHVYKLGLGNAPDDQVWSHARDNSYIVVTRDADFSELIALLGFPPKVIWIRLGNCTTSQIEALLRLHLEEIKQIGEDPEVGILSLF
jgi:predicted nuclease of predicted toxin-antitoxin system